jgi:hypothetical protein
VQGRPQVPRSANLSRDDDDDDDDDKMDGDGVEESSGGQDRPLAGPRVSPGRLLLLLLLLLTLARVIGSDERLRGSGVTSPHRLHESAMPRVHDV